MKQNQTILKYSNKIITLLLLCFVAVMMTPRGNLAPWSFNNGKGLSQIESFTELLKTEKRAFDSKNVFAFDPDWEDVSPFIKGKDGFSLRVNIGGNTRIFFPPVLNSRSPIKIRTRNKTVKQYLSSGGTYRGELVGRYLVYRGKGRDILYRYDTDSNELREFVYVPTKDSLNTDGEVIRWRFEGVNLSLEPNGNVRLIHSRNPSEKLAQIADNGMQSRISRFLNKRNHPLSKEPIEKTLFVIPRPDYIDGNFKTLTKGIRYEVFNNELKLKLNTKMDFRFPLWIDPTLRADADADVILNHDGGGNLDNGDEFGNSVASAGDFNGDGIDDIIVGAQLDDNNCTSRCGVAFIFFGGITGTKTSNADADVILNGQSDNDRFGVSVASAGDFNGDGKDDVIVGANLDDNNSADNSGSAFIFFGGITGTKTADADADVILNGQSAGDAFGISVASAGDFNGDGKDDVIIGADEDDNNSTTNSGSAFIFFGGITGTKRADADADVILNGQSSNDRFGESVASAGDFDGDGKDDVIVGAAFDLNNVTNTQNGRAFIFFGGITATKRADADADVIINGETSNGLFGGSVASAGDFNGDGKDDVIVGAIETSMQEGAAYIFFGGITGTKTAGTDADVILNGQSAGDSFGFSVASAGDFNGDGKDDVIVGAYLDDNNSASASGSAFIFFGGITGTKTADADADVILDGQSAGDNFGKSVASAVDFNGDGASDVIVGAVNDENLTRTDTGSAFVFFSSGAFPSITFSDTTSSQKEKITQVTIPVTLSKTSSSTVTIDYAVTSTATGGGVDFTLASGTLSFSAGTTSQNISFTIVNDTIVERDAETITLTLSSPTEAIFVTSSNKTHTFTIVDDDTDLFSSTEGRADDTRYSSRLAISPYAQAIPNDSYTFIGISHPSLDSALTQIGLVVEVIDMTTTVNNASGRASMFTIDAGETHRIFVVNQSHPTINNINPAFTNSNTHLINTVDSAQFGQVRATTVSERPSLPAGSRSVKVGDTYKFDNLSQLLMWGSIYIESSGAGFPMEFIGDAHDSTLGGAANSNSTLGDTNGNNALPRPARGIN